MPSKPSTKTISCPACGEYPAKFTQHDDHIEGTAQPVSSVLEFACPNGCSLTPDELEIARAGVNKITKEVTCPSCEGVGSATLMASRIGGPGHPWRASVLRFDCPGDCEDVHYDELLSRLGYALGS